MRPVPEPVPLVDPVRRFVLFTNGKCGGTTLKTWFFANLDLPGLERRPLRLLAAFGPRYAWRYLRRGRKVAARAGRDVAQVRRLTNFYRQAYCRPALETGAAESFFKLAVVRHPEDRVVSGFVDKICGEDRDEPWVRAVRDAGGTDGEITFEGFLGYLERAGDDCDPHWRRQSYVMEGHALDAFARVERLEEDFRAVADRVGGAHLGLFARRFQSNPYDAAAAPDMTRRTSREIMDWREAHGAFPPKAAFLTDATRARIRRIYAADFARLPYD